MGQSNILLDGAGGGTGGDGLGCRGDPRGRPQCRPAEQCSITLKINGRPGTVAPTAEVVTVGMMYSGGFDVDFNILTAFIRLGRAGPVGAGCPPYL